MTKLMEAYNERLAIIERRLNGTVGDVTIKHDTLVLVRALQACAESLGVALLLATEALAKALDK